VDVAREGDDQTALIKRQGLYAWDLKTYRELKTQDIVGLISTEIKEWNPDAVFVDKGHIGAAVVDLLRGLNYNTVIGVDFGGKSSKATYAQKRAEMWGDMKDWLEAGGCIPEDEGLRTDLTAPEYGYNNQERIQLERKKHMKERGLASPDSADALACTFAFPVQVRNVQPGSTLDHLGKGKRGIAQTWDPFKPLPNQRR